MESACQCSCSLGYKHLHSCVCQCAAHEHIVWPAAAHSWVFFKGARNAPFERTSPKNGRVFENIFVPGSKGPDLALVKPAWLGLDLGFSGQFLGT